MKLRAKKNKKESLTNAVIVDRIKRINRELQEIGDKICNTESTREMAFYWRQVSNKAIQCAELLEQIGIQGEVTT